MEPEAQQQDDEEMMWLDWQEMRRRLEIAEDQLRRIGQEVERFRRRLAQPDWPYQPRGESDGYQQRIPKQVSQGR